MSRSARWPFTTSVTLATLLAPPRVCCPPGIESKPLGSPGPVLAGPGMAAPVRVTTDPDYFEQHPDSTELWSPGSPLFPQPDFEASSAELDGDRLGHAHQLVSTRVLT